MRSISGILAVVAALSLAAFGTGCRGSKAKAKGGGNQPQSGLATIAPKSNSTVTGTATFLPASGNRVLVSVRVAGATPGLHGVTIHEQGDCSAPDGSSAGDLWKPSSKQGGAAANPADLGNLRVGPDGRGTATLLVSGLSLTGDNDVVGKSVVISEGPTGAGGGSGRGGAMGGQGTGAQPQGASGQGGTGAASQGAGGGGTGAASQGAGSASAPSGAASSRIGCGVIRPWAGGTGGGMPGQQQGG
jgi:Cu-Zn family superoxide dismutase